jgi:CTP synthase (UTP-ammonia lyase)
MGPIKVALAGDYNPEVPAHQGIEQSFALAQKSGFFDVIATWVSTNAIVPGDVGVFAEFSGIWCVPASPYRNMEGAIWAIKYARELQLPFLGTCGGFQHALIEYARNVLGLTNADHAETNPNATVPFVSRLRCSLSGAGHEIIVDKDSPFRAAYRAGSGLEAYQCSYGLNPEFEHLLASGPLQIAARDSNGEARAFVLRGHPFFVGTLFQPERRALGGSLHPVVQAFFAACHESKLS